MDVTPTELSAIVGGRGNKLDIVKGGFVMALWRSKLPVTLEGQSGGAMESLAGCTTTRLQTRR